MNNQSQKTTLEKLLKQNILMKPEMKTRFLKESSTFSEEKWEKVIDFLSGMLHQQESILQKISEKNPNFLNDLSHAAQKGLQEVSKKREYQDHSLELQELEKMEQEFLNL